MQAPAQPDSQQQPVQPWQSLVLDMRRELIFPKRGHTIELDVQLRTPCRCLAKRLSYRARLQTKFLCMGLT